MKKFLKNAKGALAVFMGIIIIPLVTITSIFVDSGKVALARSLAESSGDLALNTILTNFDKELNEYFGLIASAQNSEEAFELARKFFVDSMLSQATGMEDEKGFKRVQGLLSGDKTYSDFLGLQVESKDITFSALENGSLTNPAILKKQIIEFNKYRAPMNALADLYDFLTDSKKQIEELDDISKMTDNKTEFYEEEGDLIEVLKKLRDNLITYDNLKISESYLKEIDGLLNPDGEIKNFYEALYLKIIYDFLNVYDINGNQLSHTLPSELVKGNAQAMPTKKITVQNDDGSNSSKSIPDIDKAFDNCYKFCLEYKKAEKSYIDMIYRNNLCEIKGNKIEDSYFANSEKIYDVQYWALIERIYADNKKTVDKFVSSYKEMTASFATLEKSYKSFEGLAPEIIGEYYEDTYTAPDLNYKNINGVSCNIAYGGLKKTYSDHLNALKNFVSNVSNNSESNDVNGAGEYCKIRDNLKQVYSTISKRVASDVKDGSISKTAVEKKILSYQKHLEKFVEKLTDGINALQDCIKIIDGTLTSDSLEKRLSDYNTKYDIWKDSVNHLNDSKSELVEKNRDEIYNKENGTAQDDQNNVLLCKITVEDINVLNKRLKNVKDILLKYQEKIQDLKFCDVSVVEIENLGTAISAVQKVISNNNLNYNSFYLTDIKKLENIKNTTKIVSVPSLSDLVINDSNNPDMNKNSPKLRTELYEFFKKQEKAQKESNHTEEKAKEDKEKYKNESEKEADIDSSGSSNADTVEISEAEGIPSKEPGSKVPSQKYDSKNSDAGSVSETLGNLFSDFAVGMRDDLIVTDYIMRMFSYDTFEKELLLDYGHDEDKTKDVKDLNPDNYTKDLNDNMNVTYWQYNKNLRNIAKNKENSASYLNEIEYILYGGKNADNKTSAYCYIYALRFACDLAPVFSAWYNKPLVISAATSISSATMGIIPVPLIKVLICLGLTCAEAAVDFSYIKKGYGIQFVKSKDDLFCSFSLSEISDEVSDTNNCIGIGISKEGAFFRYSDYIQLFLLLKLMGSGEKEVLVRTGDVIQVSMQKHNSSFLLKKSNVYFNLKADVSVKPLMLSMPINASSNNPFSELSELVKFTYNVSRGY